MKKVIIGMFLAILPIISHALDPQIAKWNKEQNDQTFKEIKTFLKEKPLITKNVNELGLVLMWERIETLKKMIWLYKEDKTYFSRQGKYAPRIWNINKRIWSHQLHSTPSHDDALVDSLIKMIKLHATFARLRMDGKLAYNNYDDVAHYVINTGRYLAEQVEKKYGKGKTVLKPIPEFTGF